MESADRSMEPEALRAVSDALRPMIEANLRRYFERGRGPLEELEAGARQMFADEAVVTELANATRAGLEGDETCAAALRQSLEADEEFMAEAERVKREST